MISFFEHARTIIHQIATYNVAGNYQWGGIAVSLAAFPIILLGRALYLFSIDSFYTLAIVFLLCFLGMLQFILESIPSERRNTIVINRLFGVLISCYYIPLQLKFIIITTLLYHVVRSLLPHLITAQWNIDLEAHPGLIGALGVDIVAGIATNIGMQILRLFLA